MKKIVPLLIVFFGIILSCTTNLTTSNFKSDKNFNIKTNLCLNRTYTLELWDIDDDMYVYVNGQLAKYQGYGREKTTTDISSYIIDGINNQIHFNLINQRGGYSRGIKLLRDGEEIYYCYQLANGWGYYQEGNCYEYFSINCTMPTPTPTPTPIPTPTPKQTPIPTPIPTIENKRELLPSNDIRGGLAVKSAYSGASTNNEIDFIYGLNLQYYNWFPKFNETRFGLNIDSNFLGYGNILTQYHKVSNLRRNAVDIQLHWRILGNDYIDELGFSVGAGYGLFQWSGTSYSYTGHGPKIKAYLEIPIIPYISILVENSFLISVAQNNAFLEQLKWSNEATIGLNFPATTQFSGIIAYKDTRFSLGKPEIYGDIGGIALLRYRF